MQRKYNNSKVVSGKSGVYLVLGIDTDIRSLPPSGDYKAQKKVHAPAGTDSLKKNVYRKVNAHLNGVSEKPIEDGTTSLSEASAQLDN